MSFNVVVVFIPAFSLGKRKTNIVWDSIVKLKVGWQILDVSSKFAFIECFVKSTGLPNSWHASC